MPASPRVMACCRASLALSEPCVVQAMAMNTHEVQVARKAVQAAQAETRVLEACPTPLCPTLGPARVNRCPLWQMELAALRAQFGHGSFDADALKHEVAIGARCLPQVPWGR